jgi:hypothetical protein
MFGDLGCKLKFWLKFFSENEAAGAREYTLLLYTGYERVELHLYSPYTPSYLGQEQLHFHAVETNIFNNNPQDINESYFNDICCFVARRDLIFVPDGDNQMLTQCTGFNGGVVLAHGT